MGTNVRARLSIGRMKVDEGFRESPADFKINGTSAVPYVLWSETARDQSKEHKENGRLLTEKGMRFWTNHSSSSRSSGV